jgi:UV DNA damage repair endonuclease
MTTKEAGTVVAYRQLFGVVMGAFHQNIRENNQDGHVPSRQEILRRQRRAWEAKHQTKKV